MHGAIAYLRANAAHFPPDQLNHALRAAGHDEATIGAAWAQLRSMPQAGIAVGHEVRGGGAAVEGPRTTSMIPRPVIAVVAVAVAASLAFGTLQLVGNEDAPARSARATSSSPDDTKGAKGVVPELSKADLRRLEDIRGGARVRGTLPAGWQQDGQGVWLDEASGNKVTVASAPLEDQSLAEYVESEVARSMEFVDGLTATKPTATEVDGWPALTYRMELGSADVPITATQWVVEVGSSLRIINVSANAGSAEDRSEAARLVQQLEF